MFHCKFCSIFVFKELHQGIISVSPFSFSWNHGQQFCQTHFDTEVGFKRMAGMPFKGAIEF